MPKPYYSNGPSIKERSMTAVSILLLVGLFATAGAIMAFYFLKNPDILFSKKHKLAPSSATNHARLNGNDFFIPQYLVSKIERNAVRQVKKIRLTVPTDWVSGYSPIAFTTQNDLEDWLFATISPSVNAMPKKVWLRKIYRHYIAGPAAGHSSGLLRYRFLPDSPYGDTELFLDNLQNPTLFIRCELQASSLGARFCTRTLRINQKTSVDYRFTRANIAHWQKFHKTIEKLVKAIYRPSK